MEYYILLYGINTKQDLGSKGKQNTANFCTSFFFCKNRAATLTTTPCKLFYIIFVDIFFLKSLTHEKINRIRVFLT